MRIFQSIRKRLVANKKLNTYLRYALGEIILVTLGILIGLSLNKWNEERKQDLMVESDLEIVYEELLKDTLKASAILERYEEMKPQIDQIIGDTFPKEELMDCRFCLSMLTSFIPLIMEKRGYDLIKSYGDISRFKQDTLLANIIAFYSTYTEVYDINSKLLTNNMERNLIDFQDNYDWFADVFAANNYTNPAFVEFIINDKAYRNKVAYQSNLIYDNYLPLLESFVTEAGRILKDIEERLDIPSTKTDT